MSKRQPFVMMTKAVLNAAAKIDPSAQVVLLALYRIQSDAKPEEKELFRAGAKRIETYCGLKRATIQRKMKKLEGAGLIRIKSGRRADRTADQEANQVTLLSSLTERLVDKKENEPSSLTERLVDEEKGDKREDEPVSHQLASQKGITSLTERPLLASQRGSYKDTKIKDTLSTLSKPKRESQKRESVEVMIQRVAKELNTPEEQVEAHWEKHRGSMAGMNSGAYATPNTFAKYMDGQPRPKPQATPEETKGRWVKVIDSAKGERAHYWSQWPDAVSQTWEDARSNEKGEFMQSIPGASYLALAEAKSNNGSTFTITPESGEIVPSV